MEPNEPEVKSAALPSSPWDPRPHWRQSECCDPGWRSRSSAHQPVWVWNSPTCLHTSPSLYTSPEFSWNSLQLKQTNIPKHFIGILMRFTAVKQTNKSQQFINILLRFSAQDLQRSLKVRQCYKPVNKWPRALQTSDAFQKIKTNIWIYIAVIHQEKDW